MSVRRPVKRLFLNGVMIEAVVFMAQLSRAPLGQVYQKAKEAEEV